MTQARLTLGTTLVLLLGGTVPVRAAPPGTNGLPLASDAYGLLSVDRAQVDEPGKVGVRFDLNYRNGPLELPDSTGQRELVVDQDAELRLHAHFGVISRLQAGFWMPIAYQSLRERPGGPFVDGAAVGDLRLYLKAQLVNSKYVGFSTVLAVAAPTSGFSTAHGGDGVWSGEPRLILDIYYKWFGFVVNVGARIHDTVRAAGFTLGPELTWGAALRFLPHRKVTLALETVGSESLDPAGGAAERTVGILASVFGEVGRGVRLYAGGGRSVAPDAARTDVFRFTVGLAWTAPPPEAVAPVETALAPVAPPPPKRVDGDSDHDGISDGRDKCPYQAEDADGFDDSDGCPDEDNDGVGSPGTELEFAL